MASIPPSSSFLIPLNPSNNHHWHHNNHTKNQYRCQDNNRWKSSKLSLALEAGAGGFGGSSTTSGITPLAFSSSRLAPKFASPGSTWFAVNMHFGCPNKLPHTKVANEALHCLLQAGNDPIAIEDVLLIYEHRLCRCGDYIYLLHDFGNTGHFLQANKCYEIAMWGENERVNKGKLTCAMISTLGRLGKIKHALRLFEISKYEGYGNTVCFYSAMIEAFCRNGYFPEAINLFKSMNSWGLEPNLTIYNALLNATAKVGKDFDTSASFLDEMAAKGSIPLGIS